MPKVGHLSKKRIGFAHWAPDQGFFLSGGSGGSLCLELICLGPVFLQSHEEIPSHVCLDCCTGRWSVIAALSTVTATWNQFLESSRHGLPHSVKSALGFHFFSFPASTTKWQAQARGDNSA